MSSANGTDVVVQDNTSKTSEVKPPVLKIETSEGAHLYECRDLDDITYNEQIQANQLLDRMQELQETMREYSELDSDDDADEWGDIPQPPQELEEAWRRFHKRVVRFAFPTAPKDELMTLSAAQVARASSSFTTYLMRYGERLGDDAEGNAEGASGNRKSRRASRKRSRA